MKTKVFKGTSLGGGQMETVVFKSQISRVWGSLSVGMCGAIMPSKKELPKAPRKEVVNAYESGKEFKKITKVF